MYFGTFNNPKLVIGADREIPAKKLKPAQSLPNIHDDKPFRPFGTKAVKREQMHSTLMPFPGAHRGEIKVTKRKVPYGKDPPAEADPFKMTHKG